ncbi:MULTISPECIES: SPOR domain-containing protein [unclassified Oceanispirochaeta]|uniref:SPOR domain-containing protein n=1 Tax=unclassified Oceanispirochaeta TaxID=2635722 RepID=UPI000E08E9B2|nr:MULTISPECIES: SPOR domain-containing protein [unclassified Oceanispirochaeta]MBF9014726.1 SPOR domain-containing protein [Oceanispirochaeta sp. M2]NPD70982.1 SPOR domain-containing protein [Oceanispirochaeta sp. M1]RDG33815.1 SPOR domain-containing protein [Oceanispirochaeta sp. M1]
MDNQENNRPVDNHLKTLWVLLSALGLLIIVGTAGFFFFSPDKNTDALKPALAATTLVPEKNNEFDPIELARDSDEVPGMMDKTEDSIEIELIDADSTEVESTEEIVDNTPAPAVIKAPVIKAPEAQYKDVTVQVFWIQVGSYSSLTKAESVSDSLKSRGLTTTVQSKSVGGNAVFRVRIGAFNTKAEADKFSVQVKGLEGYEESFVIQSPMIKKVPLNS